MPKSQTKPRKKTRKKTQCGDAYLTEEHIKSLTNNLSRIEGTWGRSSG